MLWIFYRKLQGNNYEEVEEDGLSGQQITSMQNPKKKNNLIKISNW